MGQDISRATGLLSMFETRITPVGSLEVRNMRYDATPGIFELYHCVRCGGSRRHYIYIVSASRFYQWDSNLFQSVARLLPATWIFQCQQCDLRSSATMLDINNILTLSIVSEERGGAHTPNTPAAVSYYLDEARNSELAQARSAAAAMYRSALEHLLFEQGFKGKLNDQIRALVAQCDRGAGPSWAATFDHDFLDLFRKIGNMSVHTNNGDISEQKKIDDELLQAIRSVMMILLDLVYEEPERLKSRKALMQAATTTPPRPTTTNV